MRRAHRAAYVSNLLRRKPAARAGPGLLRPSSDSAREDPADADAAAPADASDTEVADELGEVVLTQQQEAEFELELQKVLEVAQAGKKAVLALELPHLAELLRDDDEDSSDGEHHSSSEEEEEETQAPVWKVISTPKAVPKVCAAAVCRQVSAQTLECMTAVQPSCCFAGPQVSCE